MMRSFGKKKKALVAFKNRLVCCSYSVTHVANHH